MTNVDPARAKLIGLLGGMSWCSTVTYYREINRAVQARLGGSHSARLLVWSDDYEQVERMQLAGEWEQAGEWLARAALRLEAAGAEVLGIACNTMHRVAPAVREGTQLPLVDMVEVAAGAAARRSVTRAALLGTGFTLDMGQYQSHLRQRGIGVVDLSDHDRAIVDHAIYHELCLGVVSDATGHAIRRVADRVVAQGADAVILACTELNLVFENHGAVRGAPVIDAASEHVAALVAASLGPTSP